MGFLSSLSEDTATQQTSFTSATLLGAAVQEEMVQPQPSQTSVNVPVCFLQELPSK